MEWLTAAVCLGLAAAPLPSSAAPRQKSNPYFHTCRYRARYWDDCVQTVAQELRPLFAEGVPELGVRPIDPLFVDTFNFSEVSGKFRVHLRMSNVTMEGLSDYYVTGVRSNLQELSMEIRLRVPSLTFRAHYHMDGRFLFLALSGGGTCQYNFTDVDNKVAVQGHLVRRVSDDALHFRVNTLQWTMLPSKGSSHFSAPEGDSSVYSHATCRLLNDHGEEGWRSFQGAAEQAFAEVFRERINRLMMNIPYRDLFPPGVLPLHLLELPMADNVADEYPPLYWTRPSTTTTSTTTTSTTTTSTTTTSTTTAPTTTSTTTASTTTVPTTTTTSQPATATTTFEVTQGFDERIEYTTQDVEKPATEIFSGEPPVVVASTALTAPGSPDEQYAPDLAPDAPGSGSIATPEFITESAAADDAQQPGYTDVLDDVIRVTADLLHNDSASVDSENAAAPAVAGGVVTADVVTRAPLEGEGRPAHRAEPESGADQNQNQEGATAAVAAGAVPWQDRQDSAQGEARGAEPEGVNGVVKEDGQRDVSAPPRTDLGEADNEDRIASFDTAFTLDDVADTARAPSTPSVLPVDVYIGGLRVGQREVYTVVGANETPPDQGKGEEGVVGASGGADTTADTITPWSRPDGKQMNQVVVLAGDPSGLTVTDEAGSSDRSAPTDIASMSTEPPAMEVEEATEADNSIPDEDDDDQPLPLSSRDEREASPATSAADVTGNTTTTMTVEDSSPLATLGQVVSAIAKDLIAEVSEAFGAVSAPAGVGEQVEQRGAEAPANSSSRG